MQTAIAYLKIVEHSAAQDSTPAASSFVRRAVKTFARTWDLAGVVAVMSSSAVYGIAQLMTLAR